MGHLGKEAIISKMGQLGYESLQILVTLAAIISKLGHPRSEGVNIKFYFKIRKKMLVLF